MKHFQVFNSREKESQCYERETRSKEELGTLRQDPARRFLKKRSRDQQSPFREVRSHSQFGLVEGKESNKYDKGRQHIWKPRRIHKNSTRLRPE